ncbi:hypothetical protein Droror1_Dr00010495 [Drosera rotundifolia]
MSDATQSHHHHFPRRHMTSTQAFNVLKWHYSQFDDRNFKINGHTLFYVLIIFSIILLLFLFHLYVRWYIRFRHPPSSASSSLVIVTTSSTSRAQCGLDQVAICHLPVIVYGEKGGGDVGSECCICLGGFEEGDMIKRLPSCQHCYHSDCIDKWLLGSSSCPLCRVLVQVE